MATELEAPLTARRAIADDVGLDAARFEPDAEAGELIVPMLELFGSRDRDSKRLWGALRFGTTGGPLGLRVSGTRTIRKE